MTALYETAYPRFKSHYALDELQRLFAPSREELSFIQSQTKSTLSQFGLTLLLKTTQFLGQFANLKQIPTQICEFIAGQLHFTLSENILARYTHSGGWQRHKAIVRRYLTISNDNLAREVVMWQAAKEAAQTKHELPDIINAILEELVRQRYELPAFSGLKRIARKARRETHDFYYQSLFEQSSIACAARIRRLLKAPMLNQFSLWQKLKEEPKAPAVIILNSLLRITAG